MTILSSESSLVGTGAIALPRVNLLPPEIAAQRAFRRVQVGLGVALLGAVGVAGMMYVSAAHSVSSAQADLDAAKVRTASLQTEINKYGGVQGTYLAAAAAKSQLAQAMGDEVRFSQLLNDLSLSIPGNVWITNVGLGKGATTGVATAPGQPTRLGAAAAPAVPTAVAELSFQGVAFSHDDVATWLESLVGVRGLRDAYFSNSAESTIGERTVVNFDSTVTVTSDMLSGRYTKAG